MKRLVILFYILIVTSAIGQTIWEPINLPDTLRSKAINAEQEGLIFVATGGNNEFNGLFRTTDEGNNWELLQLDTLGGYKNIFTIEYDNDGNLLVGTGQGIFRSQNNGDDFEKIFPGGPNVLNLGFSPSNEIYAACWSFIFRSSDNGVSWDTLFTGGNMYFHDIDFGLNGEIFAVGGSFDGPNTGSGFHRSLDNGETWENIGITDQHLDNIEVNAEGEIMVGSESTAIYLSSDNGENWTIQSNLITSAMETNDQDNLYIGVNGYDYEGFRFSEDWGNNWSNLNDTILNPYIHQISISPGNIIYIQCENVTGQQYQLFKSINPIVSINQTHFNNEINLYPNPTFDKIYFQSKKSTEIKQIRIYNQNGQKILTKKLIENNIDVSTLKSGLYIIELEYDDETIRKKIVIE